MATELEGAMELLPSSPAFLTLLSHLLKIGVCPRCCFRILNVRERVYSSKSLFPSSILGFLSSKLISQSFSLSTDSEQQQQQQQQQQQEKQPSSEEPTNNFNEGMESPCLVCAGILHSFFGKIQNGNCTSIQGHSESAQSNPQTVVNTESNTNSISVSNNDSNTTEAFHSHLYDDPQNQCDSIFEQIINFVGKGSFEFEDFCLEITLPPFVFARENSLSYYIQNVYFKVEDFQGSVFEKKNIISMKEIVKWTLIEPLEKELSAKYDSNSDFRIALVFNHDLCVKELNFLFDYHDITDDSVKLEMAKNKNDKLKNKHDNCDDYKNEDNFDNEIVLNTVASVDDDDNCDDMDNIKDKRPKFEKKHEFYDYGRRKSFGSFQIQNYLSSLYGKKSSNEWNNQIDKIKDVDFLKKNFCPPQKLTYLCNLKLFCWRKPIYVGGKYLKFSRNVSQSRWLIDDERKGDSSVQEIIANFLIPIFKCDGYKFIAAGREDIDVRMLGGGRPFTFEILNSKNIPTDDQISQIQDQINSSKDQWVSSLL